MYIVLRMFAATITAAACLAIATPSAAAVTVEDFGRCLAREGAIFYGASWCPHCRRQRETLGDAMSSIRYIECSMNGQRGTSAPECVSAKIESYPTWVFGDGSRAGGALSLARLALKTGCEPPSAAGGEPGTSGKDATPGGSPAPRVIEVPQ
jgi:hypothetical protein